MMTEVTTEQLLLSPFQDQEKGFMVPDTIKSL